MNSKLIFTPEGFPEPGPAYLAPTRFFDFDTPSVRAFVDETLAGERDEVAKAVKLYYAVRDRIRYDPFKVELKPQLYQASSVLAAGSAFCIPKASLLVACARAAGIPCAIGLSDVRNHLTTPKLQQRMGGRDLFVHHGYAVMYLDGRWLKAAPAFNIEMCRRFDVLPTEFDGRSDAIFQQFDARSRRHMEYVRDHGVWSDLPYQRIEMDFAAFYPEMFFQPGAGEQNRAS